SGFFNNYPLIQFSRGKAKALFCQDGAASRGLDCLASPPIFDPRGTGGVVLSPFCEDDARRETSEVKPR
ncbi:MAG: hypothetical protein ABSE80_14655, partial [Halobacteriota archaeon]